MFVTMLKSEVRRLKGHGLKDQVTVLVLIILQYKLGRAWGAGSKKTKCRGGRGERGG